MKVLHTADWHFREKDFDEIFKCVSFIADKAIEEKPDLICISGDMTDSRLLNLDSRSARAILGIGQSMLDIAPVAIVIGTPSHDGHAALALRECRGKYPILVSDMPGQYIYSEKEWTSINDPDGPKSDPEFIITQIPQPTKQYFINDLSIEDTEKAIGNAMGNMFAGFGIIAAKFEVPHIANGHGQVGGAFISETQQLIGLDIEVSKAQLKTLNADLICYGHIHKSQDMGDGIFYSGSPTRMNHGETEDKGFYVHNVDVTDGEHPDYCNSEFIKTPARQMIGIKSDYTNDSESIPLQKYIDSMDSMDDDLYNGCHVKFELKGWQDDLSNISQDQIKKKFYDAGADHVIVNLIRVPRETVRAEKVLEAETLPDKIKAMAELRGEKVSSGIIDKAKSIEAGEQSPWIQEIKKTLHDTIGNIKKNIDHHPVIQQMLDRNDRL